MGEISRVTTRKGLSRARLAGVACAVALVAALSGCGDGAGSGAGSAIANGQASGNGNGNGNGNGKNAAAHTLLIELDGATYAAVQSGIASGALPNLGKFLIDPAYSGGVNGTLSQQPSLDTPSWATVLTGTWADRHQVYSDAPNQAMHASSLFAMTKSASAGLNGAAVASSGLASLLMPDRNAGYLDTLTDCSQSDQTCVTTQAQQMIASNYTTVVAQYHSAEDAALNDGLTEVGYADTLKQLDGEVGSLVAAATKHPNVPWLIVVTGGHGLNPYGGTDDLPLVPESTTFIGLSQPGNQRLEANPVDPTTFADLYTHASIADITPTLLSYLNEMPVAANYTMDGGELVGALPVSQLAATVSNNDTVNADVVLTWMPPSSGAITVLRNGQPIATLPAGTATYTDNQLPQILTATGTYDVNYTVEAGSASVATLAQVSYIQPTPLATTLPNGLVTYYPFGSIPALDALKASTLGPWQADADGGTLVPDPFGGEGLQIASDIADSNGYDGYKMLPDSTADDVTQSPQFTVGFWYKTNCLTPGLPYTDDVPVWTNKNYTSGAYAGVAIGMFAGSSLSQCQIAFNIGDGKNRADAAYTPITANQWIYISLSVDTINKQFVGNVFDPVLGHVTRTVSTGSVDLTKMGGAAVATYSGAAAPAGSVPIYGLAEDTTGTYLKTRCASALPYSAASCGLSMVNQQYSDFATWNRLLTTDELQSIVGAYKPLSTLPGL